MPDPGELLAVWERGAVADALARAMLLHALARPDAGPAELLAAAVGDRDADLLRWHRGVFGPVLALQLDCAGCGLELEFELGIDALVGIADGPPDGTVPVAAGDWSVLVQAPRVADLEAAAAGARSVPGGLATGSGAALAAARRALLAGCVVRAERAGKRERPDELPDEVVAAVADRLAGLDPLADPRLDVPCGECGHRTKAVLDVAGSVWAQLDAWARDLILDVHLLAASYGWREPDVLALGPARRALYLELAGHD